MLIASKNREYLLKINENMQSFMFKIECTGGRNASAEVICEVLTGMSDPEYDEYTMVECSSEEEAKQYMEQAYVCLADEKKIIDFSAFKVLL